jgi:hypothetical protein
LIHIKEEELGTLEEEENKVLAEHHRFMKKLLNDSPTDKMVTGSVISIDNLRDATLNDVLVIDSQLLLFYPLDDIRTAEERRELYLMQEQLMISLAQNEREEATEEELSSPTEEQVGTVNWTEISVKGLKDLTEEQVATFKAQNQAHLHKIYPELDEDISS